MRRWSARPAGDGSVQRCRTRGIPRPRHRWGRLSTGGRPLPALSPHSGAMPSGTSRRVSREQRAAVAGALADEHGGVVHRRDLRAAGISRHDVRSEVTAGRWTGAGRHTVVVGTGPPNTGCSAPPPVRRFRGAPRSGPRSGPPSGRRRTGPQPCSCACRSSNASSLPTASWPRWPPWRAAAAGRSSTRSCATSATASTRSVSWTSPAAAGVVGCRRRPVRSCGRGQAAGSTSTWSGRTSASSSRSTAATTPWRSTRWTTPCVRTTSPSAARWCCAIPVVGLRLRPDAFLDQVVRAHAALSRRHAA